MVKFLNLALSFFCVLGVSYAQFNPRALIFDRLGCSGAYVSIPTQAYTPDLATIGFDNRAHSVSLRGTWLFYDNKNFNINGNAAMEYIFEGAETCVDFHGLAGYVSSIKFVGKTEDYRQDTITFYETTYFQANEEYVEHDIPNLSLMGRISSLIVTGSSPWTIYDKTNFRGNAICLQPESSPYYEPAFVPDTINLEPTVPHGTIASVRKGCYTTKIAKIAVSTSKGTHFNKSV